MNMATQKETLKVVITGAASAQWAHSIAKDVVVALSQDRVVSTYEPHLVLEDVDGRRLEPMAQLTQMTAEMLGRRVTVSHTTDQKQALEGARFCIASIGVGTLEAMQHDLELPREYGIFQPVGDTISIGGAVRAARNIPAMVSIAQDLEDLGADDPWMINLTNPLSMLCRAVTRQTTCRTVGCCHELYGGMRVLADWLGFDSDVWRYNCELAVVGINHCGWLQSLTVDGKDGIEQLRAYREPRGMKPGRNRLYDSDCPDLRSHNVKIHLFLTHGVFPYSGDRHTAEFFEEFINRQTNMGADWGVMLTTAQERLVHHRGGGRAVIKQMLEGRKRPDPNLSQEAAGRIIPAVLFDEPFRDVGNVPCEGDTLPGVPEGAVIERMVTYDRRGAHPDPVEPLPAPLQKHLADTAVFIEDVVRAVVERDRALFIGAMERDPLMRNMDRRKIPELVDRLFKAHEIYLGKW
jgi:alpha-galactosidase